MKSKDITAIFSLQKNPHLQKFDRNQNSGKLKNWFYVWKSHIAACYFTSKSDAIKIADISNISVVLNPQNTCDIRF